MDTLYPLAAPSRRLECGLLHVSSMPLRKVRPPFFNGYLVICCIDELYLIDPLLIDIWVVSDLLPAQTTLESVSLYVHHFTRVRDSETVLEVSRLGQKSVPLRF